MNTYEQLDDTGRAIVHEYVSARALHSPATAARLAYAFGRRFPAFRHWRAPDAFEKLDANGSGRRSYRSPLADMLAACGAPLAVGEYGSHSAGYPRTRRSEREADAARQAVIEQLETMRADMLTAHFGHMGAPT